MLSSLIIFSCLSIGFGLITFSANSLIYAENTTSIKIDNTVIAKEPFFQSINGTITSIKALNTTGYPQNEISFMENAMINSNLSVINEGVFVDTIHPNKLIVGKGTGTIITLDGQNATWNAEDVGRMTSNGNTLYQGVVYFDTDSKESLAFLKGLVGIYISNVGKEDSQRNIWIWSIE